MIDNGASPSGDRAFVPAASSPAVSPVPASIPSAEDFREAVIDELVCCHIYSAKHDANPKLAIHEAIAWNVEVALDPQVSASARGLLDLGYIKAMQDASALTQQLCGTIGARPGSSIHSALSACWEKMEALASAIEARRAETGTGSVHESAGPQDDAQPGDAS